MNVRLALLACLVATPALAQQPAGQAGLWGAPIAGFAERFNDNARRIDLNVRAVEVECTTRDRTLCRYSIGRAMLLVQSPIRSSGVEKLLLTLTQPEGRQDMSQLMAMEATIALTEPTADQPERMAIIQALVNPDNVSNRATRANLRSTSFEMNIAPPVGFLLSAAQRSTASSPTAAPAAQRTR